MAMGTRISVCCNIISLFFESASNGKPYFGDRFSSLYLKIELDTIKRWLKGCCCPDKVIKINTAQVGELSRWEIN
jgi:hypothetical protein